MAKVHGKATLEVNVHSFASNDGPASIGSKSPQESGEGSQEVALDIYFINTYL